MSKNCDEKMKDCPCQQGLKDIYLDWCNRQREIGRYPTLEEALEVRRVIANCLSSKP